MIFEVCGSEIYGLIYVKFSRCKYYNKHKCKSWRTSTSTSPSTQTASPSSSPSTQTASPSSSPSTWPSRPSTSPSTQTVSPSSSPSTHTASPSPSPSTWLSSPSTSPSTRFLCLSTVQDQVQALTSLLLRRCKTPERSNLLNDQEGAVQVMVHCLIGGDYLGV